MTLDEIHSESEPQTVQLLITPREGEPIECSISAVRWSIVTRSSCGLLYCPSCNELVKEENCRPQSRIESQPRRPTLCATCHDWMVVVDFIQRQDVQLPAQKNSREMWRAPRRRSPVS
ncbi:hypothetical protein [Halocatena halophila]|uniref:hypothetical protein n=1 Tax=Halocatena halophila TaxID=2814576 RepID=UPI002ED3F88B